MDGSTEVFSMSTEAFRALLSLSVLALAGLIGWAIRRVGKVLAEVRVSNGQQQLMANIVLGNPDMHIPPLLDRLDENGIAIKAAVKAANASAQQATALATAVDEIRREVTHNGGTSLKDIVRKTRDDLAVHLGEAEAAHVAFRDHLDDKGAH